MEEERERKPREFGDDYRKGKRGKMKNPDSRAAVVVIDLRRRQACNEGMSSQEDEDDDDDDDDGAYVRAVMTMTLLAHAAAEFTWDR